MLRLKHKKAMATVEYSVLIITVLMAFYVMQRYIFRGIAGKWKSVGDSFGYGRQYDPGRTQECVFDTEFGLNVYYDRACMVDKECPDPHSKKGKRCMADAVAACTADCV